MVGLAVAAVGVVGTLCAAVGAQVATLRGKRIDAEIQRAQRVEDLADSARKQEFEEKRAAYSDLNAAVRDYRMSLHDCVMRLGLESAEDLSGVEATRLRFREMYARAQMVVPDRILDVAAEVDLGLSNSHRTLLGIADSGHAADDAEKLHRWLDGPGSKAVWLLRRVLREDIGVALPVADLHVELESLRQARAECFAGHAGVDRCRLVGDAGMR